MRLCPDAARARSLRASAFNNKGGRRTMTTLGTRSDSLSFPASRIDDNGSCYRSSLPRLASRVTLPPYTDTSGNNSDD